MKIIEKQANLESILTNKGWKSFCFCSFAFDFLVAFSLQSCQIDKI